jgi:hypothetical protein
MPATPVSPFPICLNQVQGCLSRLVTFCCQKVGQWLDRLGIFILAPLKEGTSREEVTQPNALGPNLPQWLWKHSDCYNLQKVQMRVMGMVQVALLGTRRHRDETLWPIQLLPILLWFPQRWRSAWIRQSGRRSSHLTDESEVLLCRSMFPKEDAVVRLLITQKASPTRRNLSLVIQLVN